MKNKIQNPSVGYLWGKLSAVPDAIDIHKTEFEAFTKDYTKDKIFDEAEIGLNFKILSQKSLA